MINIPIFITLRACNEEEKYKSAAMLPYAYHYMNEQQFTKRCIIISAEPELLAYAKDLGFENTFLEPCKHCGQCTIEMNGILHWLRKHSSQKYDWFISFRIDQPFKDTNLLYNVIRAINDNYDVICSNSQMKDRSKLFISDDDKFLHNVDNAQRMIDYCPTVKFIDSSIMAIKTSFFMNCCVAGASSIISQADFYQNFWAGKFLSVENKTMFIQVLTKQHLDRFKVVYDTYQKVCQLPQYDPSKYERKD